MSPAATLSATELDALISAERAVGTRVIGPVRDADGALRYRAVDGLEQLELGGGLPREPLKRLFLPPTEELFSWHRHGREIHLEEVPTSFPRRLVVGAPPCDAAALALVDRVMGWDPVDELWFGRRRSATLIGLACRGAHRSCCCDRVGLGPEAGAGSDLLLHPDRDGFRVEVVSERGRELLAAHRGRESSTTARLEPAVPPSPPSALPGLEEWLDANFDHPVWSELALPCHGCGVCAAVCPTCHCFDIVDEPEGVSHGTRRRNWDTCQSASFTVHASGHNPRPDQAARLRQRIRHKFAIYPRRFGAILCTGCGRCARACPAGVDLPEVLDRLQRCMTGSDEAAGGSP